jgi:hypothetical protein
MGKSDALSRRANHGTGGGDNDNITLLRPEFFAAHAVRALSGLLRVLNLLRSRYFTRGSYDILCHQTACCQTVGNLKAYRL